MITYLGTSFTMSNVAISDIGGRMDISNISAQNEIRADSVNISTARLYSTNASSVTFDSWISTSKIQNATSMHIPIVSSIQISSLSTRADTVRAHTISVEHLRVVQNTFQAIDRLILPSHFVAHDARVSSFAATNLTTSTIGVQEIHTQKLSLPETVTASTLVISSLSVENPATIPNLLARDITIGVAPTTTIPGTGQGLFISASNDVGATITGSGTPAEPLQITNSLVANQPFFYLSLSNTTPAIVYYNLRPLEIQTPLVIVSAWYGLLLNQYGRDVTSLMQTYVNTQSSVVVANSNFGGDPTPDFTSPKYLFLSYYPPNTNSLVNSSYIEGTTVTFSDFGSSIMTTNINGGAAFQIDMRDPNQLSGTFLATEQVNTLAFTWPVNNTLHVRASVYLTEPGVNYLEASNNIDMKNGVLRWDKALSTVTIDNQFNDMAIRNIQYYGSLNQISDARQKEEIEPADVERCLQVIDETPLYRFRWCEEYSQTWMPRDRNVLGILAPDIAKVFPHSVIPGRQWVTVDSEQLEMAHIGATKALQERIEELERRANRLSKI
jgi:hypothetical protein